MLLRSRPVEYALPAVPKAELTMDARQQGALAEIRQSLLTAGDLALSMAHASTIIARVLTAEYSMILEALPAQHTLVLRAGTGWPPDAVGYATIELGPVCWPEFVAMSATPTIVEDWRSEAYLEQPDLLRVHGLLSTLWTAIPGLEHPVGIVGAGSVQPRIFTSDEILFLQAVAQILGLALERNRAGQAVLEERQRLARDLHDSVTQAIYGVTLHAEAATRLLSSGDLATVAHYLRKLQNTAQEALEEMRLLIFELRPAVLDQEGLVAALQTRLGAVEGRANLETTFSAEGMTRLPPPIEQALYRIAQEALNNALKHAHAGHISVTLEQQHSLVILEISDDGAGFDPAQARASGRLGLRGIEERVAQLGGRLLLTSAPAAGTQIRIEVTV